MLTIPKSGTHLLVKALVLLTELQPYHLGPSPSNESITYRQFEQTLLQQKYEKSFFYNHLGPYGDFCDIFFQTHPNFLVIVNVRDLRDLLVSYVYHMSSRLDEEIGRTASLEEKLTQVLNPNLSRLGKSIEKNVILGIEWLQRPNVIATRFEDFVGAPGGGDENKQAQVIASLANHLGISLSSQKLKQIQFNLFGNTKGPRVSGTFRKGKIGSWKQHFTNVHIELFKKYWADHQLALGYPLDF